MRKIVCMDVIFIPFINQILTINITLKKTASLYSYKPKITAMIVNTDAMTIAIEPRMAKFC